jgi:hypothetical protein
MFSSHDVLVGVLVMVVVMLIYTVHDTTNQTDACLYGFWKADDEFNEKTGADSMFMYIGAPCADSNKCVGLRGATCPIYTIIKSGGAVVVNDLINATVRRTNVMPNTTYKYAVDMGRELGGVLPRRLNYQFDPITGMMIIESGGEMHGRMFKKQEASFFCTTVPKLEESDNEGFDDDDDGGDDYG